LHWIVNGYSLNAHFIPIFLSVKDIEHGDHKRTWDKKWLTKERKKGKTLLLEAIIFFFHECENENVWCRFSQPRI